MSQATDSTSTTGAPGPNPAAPSPRVHFSSAGAVRRPHPAPLAVPAVQAAHIALISALASLKPRPIIGTYVADRFDIIERADHLKAVLAAVVTYTKAIVSDTAYFAPTNVADETGYLVDAASEIIGALLNAVDKMIDDAALAAE
jgi:hypothetical protein